MRKIVLGVAMLLSVGIAQSQPPKDGVLIANETYLVDGKTTFHIVSINDTVCKALIEQYTNNGKADKVMIKIIDEWHGRYMEKWFYFKDEQYDEITRFINSLNKKK